MQDIRSRYRFSGKAQRSLGCRASGKLEPGRGKDDRNARGAGRAHFVRDSTDGQEELPLVASGFVFQNLPRTGTLFSLLGSDRLR